MVYVTVVGVVLAALAHLSVSRHAPPPGWGWIYALYELVVPLSLAVAVEAPHLRAEALTLAAVVALLIGGASVVMASWSRNVLVSTIDDAVLGRAVRRGTRWATDLEGPARELRRKMNAAPDNTTTPEA